MPKIIVDGRTDVEDYFRLSGVFDSERLNHTPLLVFVASDDTVRVHVINRPIALLSFDDGTPVMGQWRSEWHSDFFQFTVGQYRRYVEAQYELLKSARNVVKTVGPRGGFRSLSFEYVGEHGTTVHASAGAKAEAERLEAFFARQSIPVTVQESR